LLQQAVTRLARAPHEQPVTVPERLVLPLPHMTVGEDVDVVSPGGDKKIYTAAMRGGEIAMESDPLSVAGFYDVIGGGTELTVATNVDSAESDVKTMAPAEMESAVSGLAVRIIGGDRNVAGAVTQARTGRELWLWLLGAAAILMVTEAIFARWCTNYDV
jgi:hypothetical protein